MQKYIKGLKCGGLLTCIIFSYMFVFLYAETMKDMHDCFEDVSFDTMQTIQIREYIPPEINVECSSVNENGIGILSLIMHVMIVLVLIIGVTYSASWNMLKTLYE